MIVFDLECRPGAHRFEGWFGSSDDFADQQARGLVACPHCGTSDVIKAVMAPAVGRKGNQAAKRSAAAPQDLAQPAPLPPEAKQALEALATLQSEALKGSRWVGKGFAEQSRAMHYGERDVETIHGQATVEEARELVDEGIAVTPLLFPVVPPDQAN